MCFSFVIKVLEIIATRNYHVPYHDVQCAQYAMSLLKAKANNT